MNTTLIELPATATPTHVPDWASVFWSIDRFAIVNLKSVQWAREFEVSWYVKQDFLMRPLRVISYSRDAPGCVED
jgi:hypothetical protein